MNQGSSPQVAVIIPAHNAAATIGTAIRSALDQPEVTEIVLIDDASTDTTQHEARMAAQGDGRLAIVRMDQNVGPATGRNIAIDRSTAPYVALLDADDYFLPNRFAPMFRQSGWDIIADNIVFVPDNTPTPVTPKDIDHPSAITPKTIDFATFIYSNIPDAKAYRGELGFLKPVMSRQFLNRHALRYDPTLRLGEDFKLYVEMLLHGARFNLLTCVGYVAQVRSNSLSGGHTAADLHNLLSASLDLQSRIGDNPPVRTAMKDYIHALRGRFLLRDFLNVKRQSGLARAAQHALSPPTNAWPIARGILRDKIAAKTKRTQESVPPKRYLMPIK